MNVEHHKSTGGFKELKTIRLRPAELEGDFGQIAELFTLEQDEPTTKPVLIEDYEVHKERIFCLSVAEGERGELLGFNWATRSRFDPAQAYFYVIVKPEFRRQGAGSQLLENVESAAKANHIQQLQISVSAACPECRSFAEKHAYTEKAHYLGLALDLDAFDDRLYDQVIANLQGEGFQFTTMEALGNSVEAQRSLYLLNDSSAMETAVPEGNHSWLSFEDFQAKVCQADWYKPSGQFVAIDTTTGAWAAMSAITRFAGSEHAYNLHTGVDQRYLGQGLAQATLVLALRYARDMLQVQRVQTDENARNTAALEIFRSLGYMQTTGTVSMEKELR